MAKKFSELIDAMPAPAHALAQERAAQMELQMSLSELRRARQLSQETLAKRLDISQGSVAKLEKRADMYVSSVRRVIEAMGGQLEIIARFPDQAVHIEDLCTSKHPADA